MNDELTAIAEAIAPTDPDSPDAIGQDHKTAVQLADEYVAAHPEEFEDYKDMSIVELVQSVDNARALGLKTAQWRAETWLLHKFEPQNIGGEQQPVIRNTQ